MLRSLVGVLVALGGVLSAMLPTATAAVTIRYQVSNLSDVNAGEDLWQYIYTVEDFPFDADYGFSILFDEDLFEQLESPPPPVNADWDVITLQPDLNLPDEGRYDALALSATPSLSDVFVVSFVWLGPGAPASQPFEIFDPNFETIETGATLLLPEPSAALLAGLVLFGLCARCERRILRRAREPCER
jgi:hypothetical protein